MKVYAWLIDLVHRRKNCPTGMISGWVQKVTEHRGTVLPLCVFSLLTSSVQTKYSHVMQGSTVSHNFHRPTPCTPSDSHFLRPIPTPSSWTPVPHPTRTWTRALCPPWIGRKRWWQTTACRTPWRRAKIKPKASMACWSHLHSLVLQRSDEATTWQRLIALLVNPYDSTEESPLYKISLLRGITLHRLQQYKSLNLLRSEVRGPRPEVRTMKYISITNSFNAHSCTAPGNDYNNDTAFTEINAQPEISPHQK